MSAIHIRVYKPNGSQSIVGSWPVDYNDPLQTADLGWHIMFALGEGATKIEVEPIDPAEDL